MHAWCEKKKETYISLVVAILTASAPENKDFFCEEKRCGKKPGRKSSSSRRKCGNRLLRTQPGKRT